MPIENQPQKPEQEPHREPSRQETPSTKPNGGNGHTSKGVRGSAAALGLDLNVSIRALTAMNPEGYQHLASLNPVTGGRSGWNFAPGQWREKREFIEAEQDAGNNVYFCFNEPFPPGDKIRVDESPDKSQIAKIRGTVVDCDIVPTDAAKVQEARDKITMVLKTAASGLFTKTVPGIIADSGNGGHSFFVLPEPLGVTPEIMEKAERTGGSLQHHFQKTLGGDIAKVDPVWDISRIIRIPGTVNFPTAAKLKLGRVARASKLIEPMSGMTATLDEILADYPLEAGFTGSAGKGSSPKSGSDFDKEVAALMKQIDINALKALGGQYVNLPEDLRRKFAEALKTDEVLDDLWNNGGVGDRSASDQVYALAKGLIRGKGKTFSITDFGALVWVWDYSAGSKSVTRPDGGGNGDPRSLARCWAKALEELAERVFDDVDPNDPEVADAANAAREQAEGRKAKIDAEEEGRKAAENKVDPENLWAAKPVPMLPSGLLPGPLDSFATAFGKALGTDPGGIALGMLTTCATAIRDTIQIEITPTWSEAARLWGLIVGQPSMKKSPIIDVTTKPLQAINKELYREYTGEMARWDALSKEDKKRVPEPRRKSILVNDTTVEGAQEVLKASHDGIISVRDEMSGWFASMEQYANSTSANAVRAFWLSSYNGGPYDIHRVDKRRTGHIPNLSILLLGGIQPEAARRVIDANRQTDIGGANDGLVQRLTPVILQTSGKVDKSAGKQVSGQYEELVRTLWQMWTPVDPVAEAAAQAEWERIVEDDPPVGEREDGGDGGAEEQNAPMPMPPEPIPGLKLRFSDEADAVREALEDEHARLVMDAEKAGDDRLATTYAKHDGLFARLCIIWHCVDAASAGLGFAEPPHIIHEYTAQLVADFMRQFLRPHLEAFLADILGCAPDIAGHRKIANHILSHGLKEVTARDIQKGLSNSLRGVKAHEVTDLLEQLRSLGWVFRRPPLRAGAQPTWRVNPKVHEIFAERAAEQKAYKDEMAQGFKDRAKG